MKSRDHVDVKIRIVDEAGFGYLYVHFVRRDVVFFNQLCQFFLYINIVKILRRNVDRKAQVFLFRIVFPLSQKLCGVFPHIKIQLPYKLGFLEYLYEL